MASWLGRIGDLLEATVANLCLLVLVVVLLVQVAARYVFEIGVPWSEEVSRFAFIWFAYVSASYAVLRATHIRVTMFVDLVPARLAAMALVLADLIWIAFNALVVVSGVLLVQRMLRFPVYSTSLVLPLSYIYLVIPLAHGLMIARILQGYWRRGGRAPASAEAMAGGRPGAGHDPRER